MLKDRNENQDAFEIMQRALQAKFNGEFEKSLELMDQAILIKEKAGLNSYHEKIQKELLLFDSSPTKDFSGLISVSQNGLEQYERQGKIVEQIDLQIEIAGLLVHTARNKEALDYLDRAENLLSNSTPSEISQHLHSSGEDAGDMEQSPHHGDEIDPGEPVGNEALLILIHQNSDMSLSGETYLELRKKEIDRIRKYISNLITGHFDR